MAVIAIAMKPAAHEAIRRLLPGTNEAGTPGADGLIRIWLDRRDLTSLVGPHFFEAHSEGTDRATGTLFPLGETR
jgi:hypothetical protein